MTARPPLRTVLAPALALAVPVSVWAQAVPAINAPVPSDPVPVVTIPGAEAPAQVPYEGPAGPPAYRPALPAGTPAEEVARDPVQPVTTLVEALERAYWTNPRVLSQRATTRSTDFRLPQARAQYGPTLQYSGSYAYRDDRIESTVGTTLQRTGWTSTATAVLTQPLFTFGRLRATEDTAKAQIAFERGSLDATEQQTLLGAIDAYVSVLRDRAGVGIAQSQVDLLSREFGDLRTRLEQHDATAADFQQVESRLELARADLEVARSNAASSEADFLATVGAPAGALEAPNPLVIPVQSIDDAYIFAQDHNPVLAAAYARERVSRAQVALSKATMMPRVDLQGQADIGTLSPYTDTLRQNEFLAKVTVSQAIDGGQESRVGEARAANDADWRLIDDTLRQNRQELAEAWNAWKTQQAAVERLRIGVTSAEQAFEGAQQQQRAGLRTTTEILELARDLLQVRSSLNNSMANVLIAQARVLTAMGALSHERLLPGRGSYDPAEHFDKVKHRGDVPLLTPAVRALDSALTPAPVDRPVRDPAAPLGVGEVGSKPAP